jgi:hypothetical protein
MNETLKETKKDLVINTVRWLIPQDQIGDRTKDAGRACVIERLKFWNERTKKHVIMLIP